MISNLKNLVYNLDKFNNCYSSIFKLKQNDVRTLEIKVYEKGEEINLSGYTIAVNWVNANNTVASITTDNITVKNNTIYVKLPSDCTRSAGVAKWELHLSNNGEEEYSFTQEVKILSSVIQGQEESKNVANIIEELNTANANGEKTLNDLEEYAKNHSDITQVTADINNLYNIKAYKTFISPEEFGAKGDGITDDTEAIKNCIDFAVSYNLKIDGLGKYNISKTIVINDYVNINNLSICSNIDGIELDIECTCKINNIKLDRVNLILNAPNIIADVIEQFTYKGIGIHLNSSSNSIWYKTILIKNMIPRDTENIPIVIDGGDIRIGEIQCINFNRGIVINQTNCVISSAHSWLDSSSEFTGSKMFEINATDFRIINSCCDSIQYAVYLGSPNLKGIIQNLNIINNCNIWKNCDFYFSNSVKSIIRGTANVLMTKWGDSSDTFSFGNPSCLEWNIIDGNPVDKKLCLYGTDIKTSSGKATVDSSSSIVIDGNLITCNIYMVYNEEDNITEDYILVGDIAKIHNLYIKKIESCLYYNDGTWVNGNSIISCDANTSHNIKISKDYIKNNKCFKEVSVSFSCIIY